MLGEVAREHQPTHHRCFVIRFRSGDESGCKDGRHQYRALSRRELTSVAATVWAHSDFLPAAFAFLQRALAAAASFARAFALTFLFTFFAVAGLGFPLRFAHRAFCAAAILALTAADLFRLPRRFPTEVTDDGTPRI
jgi:hypothetical protein